jgi:hypothetical protein
MRYTTHNKKEDTMRGVLRVVRDGEVKLTLPGPSITIKQDGTLWYGGMPILGITDPILKASVAADLKAERFDRIPADAWTRLGENPNGLWAGDDAMWATHPLKAVQDAEARRREEIERRTVRVYLSSRGWGDYSPVEWVGDITRPDAEILAECKDALAKGYDVDKPTQTDAEILAAIGAARAKWGGIPVRQAEERTDIQHKIDTGYCFACESYCHGDCGHYSNDPMMRYTQHASEAAREADYGIND